LKYHVSLIIQLLVRMNNFINLFKPPKYSYHIFKKFGNDTYLAWWPLSGFDQYCTNLKIAEKQFEKECQDGSCKLIQYDTVVSKGKIIGITGEPIILKNCDKENN